MMTIHVSSPTSVLGVERLFGSADVVWYRGIMQQFNDLRVTIS